MNIKSKASSCLIGIGFTIVLRGSLSALSEPDCEAGRAEAAEKILVNHSGRLTDAVLNRGTSRPEPLAHCHETVRQVVRGEAPSFHPSTTDEGGEAAPDARYRVRAGDVIEVTFPYVPAFNQVLTVQPDGYVTLHALGPLRAAGLTVPELTEILRADYTSILREPVITVALKEFEKPYFIVAGEVERPGKYDLRGETTVTQAVAVAGGLKGRSKESKAVVFRRLPAGGFKAETLDVKKMLNEAQLGGDPRLGSGDMLFIPRGWGMDSSIRLGELISSLWIVRLFY